MDVFAAAEKLPRHLGVGEVDREVEAELDRVGCFKYSPVEGAAAIRLRRRQHAGHFDQRAGQREIQRLGPLMGPYSMRDLHGGLSVFGILLSQASKDDVAKLTEKVQKVTDATIAKIDEMAKKKEAEIMTV